MKIETYKYDQGWDKPLNGSLDGPNTLITIFSSLSRELIIKPLEEIKKIFPKSILIGASTAGEILQDEIFDDQIVVTVVKFEKTRISTVSMPINSNDSSEQGIEAASSIIDDELKSIFVLSDGLKVNGSQLAKGINSVVPDGVIVSGGLAADKDRFNETWIIAEDKPLTGYLTVIGFHGDNIHISHGSKGGWDRLGLERLVTKSKSNVLYELDGQPALALYKSYLGELADGLPSTGLLFPLEINDGINTKETQVRTILGVNESDNSITFAGDIPEGSYATLMKANMDRLIDGSVEAAKKLNFENNDGQDVLTIAISCVGRRLVLKQRTEEELECNFDIYPENTRQIGFYSYGEISTDQINSCKCDLQNQTMTLTSFWES